MRSINAATQTALATGRIVDRGLAAFDFNGTIHAFWTGVGDFLWNGITFKGVGGLIRVEAIGDVSDGSAVPVVLTMTAIPNTALSPDVLGSVESYDYHFAPTDLYTAYFDADTQGLLSVEREYRGYIDRIEHVHSIDGEDVLQCYLESKALDHQKTGYRVRSDADQKQIDALDDSLRHAPTAGRQEIFWGRVRQRSSGDVGRWAGERAPRLNR